ncbi:hypothetical protein B0T25DRAFT_613934 [Lasiosphaeria hispida]|uniref:Ankyrin repeat protein n=1 Tax=Lasiosphaeria hispida TaxID=260671 RepID=A0AAJ0HD66_9PEZI|nr:hypothetical protein B0T25DRAFT_613934 [Lasiosphaeria hispida]
MMSFGSFEIDKGSNGFRTIGLGVVPPGKVADLEGRSWGETSEERELWRALRETSLRDGDYNVVTRIQVYGIEDQITQPASIWIKSFAITGDLDSLKRCLDRSPGSSSLLRATSSDGEFLLGLAVPDGHLKAVNYLLERGRKDQTHFRR